MASVTLTLSARTSKDSGKAEVLLRYRNTREVALRAHTHTYILPKFISDGKIVIKNRIITDEVREAQEAKVQVDRIVNHIDYFYRMQHYGQEEHDRHPATHLRQSARR